LTNWKGWFSVKRLIGLTLTFCVSLVLLGGITGCPNEPAKPKPPPAGDSTPKEKAPDKKS
jgi:hypothetical protein